MKTIIDTQTLRSATDTAALFVPNKSTLPLLEYLRISANGKLEMSGSDLETSVRVSVPLVASEKKATDPKTMQVIVNNTIHDGTALVNAELFRKCVDSLPPDEVTISLNSPDTPKELKNRLSMEIGSHIVAQLAVDPNLMDLEPLEIQHEPFTAENSIEFTIELAALRTIAAKCAPFCSTDELRPPMMGVMFSYAEETLTAVASDGFILAKLQLPLLASEEFQVIVPKSLLEKAARVMRGPVTIRFHNWKAEHRADQNPKSPLIQFESIGATIESAAGPLLGATVTVTGRVITKRFFNWNAVMPQERHYFVTIVRETLRRSLDRLALFAPRESKRVTIQRHDDGFAKITAEDFGHNSAEEFVPCVFVRQNDAPFRFAANTSLLRTVLNALENEDVSIRFAGGNRAATFEEEFELKLTEEKDGPVTQVHAIYLVMPLRIDDVYRDDMRGTALAAAATESTETSEVTE